MQPPADRQLRRAAAPLLRQRLQRRRRTEQRAARQGRAGHQNDAVVLAEGTKLLPGKYVMCSYMFIHRLSYVYNCLYMFMPIIYVYSSENGFEWEQVRIYKQQIDVRLCLKILYIPKIAI